MPEEFSRSPFLKDALRLAIQVDGLLEDESFSLERALQLRHQVYDHRKHLEKLPPAPDTEGLSQVVLRAFASLQHRLTLGNE